MRSPEIICRSLAGQFTTILCLEVLQHWTNFYFSFTDCILTMLDPGAGGVLSWKWSTLCAALKTLLSRPPDPSLTPPFQNFLVPQDPTFAWNHKFLENLHFKGSKSLNKLFILASLIVSYHVGPWSPGGTQLKMGYSYVPPLRPLFHALLTLP